MKDDYIELSLMLIPFIIVLQIFAVMAKLGGYIDWSWWWVFSPMWIAPVLTIIWCFCIASIIVRMQTKDKEDFK